MLKKPRLINFALISLLAISIIFAGIPQQAPLISLSSAKPASYLVKDLEPTFGGRFLVGSMYSDVGHLIPARYQNGTYSIWETSETESRETSYRKSKEEIIKIYPDSNSSRGGTVQRKLANGRMIFTDFLGNILAPGEISPGRRERALNINGRLFALDQLKDQLVEIGTYNSWPIGPDINELVAGVAFDNDIVVSLVDNYRRTLFSLKKGIIFQSASTVDLFKGSKLYGWDGGYLYSWDSSLSGYTKTPLCRYRFPGKIQADLQNAAGNRYLLVTSLAGSEVTLLSLDDLQSGCIKEVSDINSPGFYSEFEPLRVSSHSVVFKHSTGIAVIDLKSQSLVYNLVDNIEGGFAAIDLDPEVLFTKLNSQGLVELYKISSTQNSKESKIGVIGRELIGMSRFGDAIVFSAWRDNSTATLLTYANGTLRITGKLESQSIGSSPRNIIEFNDKAAFIASNQNGNKSTDNLYLSDGTSEGTYSVLSEKNQATEKAIRKLISFDQNLYFTNERKSGDKTIAELWKTSGQKGAEVKINNITTEVGNITDLSIRAGFAIAVFQSTQIRSIYGYSYQVPVYDVWKLTVQGSQIIYRFESPPLILEPEANDQSGNLEFIARDNSNLNSLYQVTRQSNQVLKNMPDILISLAALKINNDILLCGVKPDGSPVLGVLNTEVLSFGLLPNLPRICSNIIKNKDGTLAVTGPDFLRIINQDNLLESVTIKPGLNQILIDAVSHSRLYYLTYDTINNKFNLYSLNSDKTPGLLLTSNNILPLQNATEIGGTLYFSARDDLGIEPWATSGEVSNTKRLDDIATGDLDSTPSNYTKVGDNLFFSAFDPANGFELWTLDRCPGSSYKFSAGSCGCDTLDIDSDSDGIYDCKDSCPRDGLKNEAGICGCGTPDRDINSNWIIDCKEPKVGPSAPQVATPTPKISLPKVDSPTSNAPASKTLKAPTVKINKKQITVSFKEYNKKQVSVFAQLIGQNKSKRIKSKTGTAIFKDLGTGKWRVWYMTDSDKLLSVERVVSVKKP